MGSTQRYVSIARSDLAAVIYDSLDGAAELILDDSVQALVDDGDRVRVTFETGHASDFDLVVGADGLHSRVRRLAFGPDESFEKYLGIVVAAFEAEGYRPRDDLIAMMHAEVGFQAVRLSLRDDLTLFLLSVRHKGLVPTDDRDDTAEPAANQTRRCRLGDAGDGGSDGPGQDVLLRLGEPDPHVVVDLWPRGAGRRCGGRARRSWPARVRRWRWWRRIPWPQNWPVVAITMRRSPATKSGSPPCCESKQDAAIGLGLAFAPSSRLQLLVRNTVMRLMGLPKVADLAMGRSFRDAVELPTFAA